MFKVEVELKGSEAILADHGLDKGGNVQRFFSSEVMRVSNKYLPFKAGALQSSARLDDSGDAIIYSTPYARYHWYGKLMVDPITKKGSFYNPRTGRHWSRPNTPKELTDKNLKYNGSPLRGPRWVERAWIDNKDSIIKATQGYMGGIK